MQKRKGLLLYLGLLVLTGAAVLVWMRVIDPRGQPVAGEMHGASLVLSGRDFSAPDPSPEQTVLASHGEMTIEVLPDQPLPSPADRGVRILLAPERTAHVNDRAVIVEIEYRLPDANPASHLAVSLQGIEPSEWVTQSLQGGGKAHFALAPQSAVDAIGLRAFTESAGMRGGVIITNIRISPAPDQAAQHTEADVR